MQRSVPVVAAALIVVCHLDAAALRAQSEPVATRPTAPPVPADTMVIEQQATPAPPAAPSCWRAHPRCPAFFLTDIGIEHPVAATKHPRAPGQTPAFHTRVVWTIGLMGVTGRHAHGGTASLVSEAFGRGVPFMLEYRYRNWLGESSALDVSVGYKRRGFTDTGVGMVPANGVTTMLAYSPNRWIGFTARADFLRAAGDDRRAIYLGLNSTRVSEEALKFTLVTMVQLMLERIGVTSDENE